MSKPYVATANLYVGTALAYAKGDIVEDESAVTRNGWQDSVSREGTKGAETAAKDAVKAAEAPGLATGISGQVNPGGPK